MATADLAELVGGTRTRFLADAALKRAGRTLLYGIDEEVLSRRPYVSMAITSQEDMADFGTPHTDHLASFTFTSKNQVQSELFVLAKEFYRVFHEQTITFGVTGSVIFLHQGIIEEPHLVDGAFQMVVQYMLGVTWG